MWRHDVANMRRNDSVTMLYSTTLCGVTKCLTKFILINSYSTRSWVDIVKKLANLKEGQFLREVNQVLLKLFIENQHISQHRKLISNSFFDLFSKDKIWFAFLLHNMIIIYHSFLKYDDNNSVWGFFTACIIQRF